MEGVSWLEVLDARGGLVARTRLERFPFVIGRGYAGDLVLDDAELSAAHVRITVDQDGTVVAEDLQSENGLWTAAGERVSRAPLLSGDTLRAGRLTLRFLAPGHPVPPAASSAPAEPSTPVARERPTPRAGLSGARGAVVLAAAATAVATVQGYFGSYDRTDPGTQIGEAVGYALLIAAYAGIWAFIGRVTVQRFSFGAHVAIASAGVLAFSGLTVVSEYLTFLAPDSAVAGGLAGLLMLALGAALLYWHLERATAFRTGVRAGVAAAVLGAIVLLVLAGEWEEEFSSYPEFSAVVKPVGVGLTRRTSASDFVAGAADLAGEVDSLAAKPVR